MSLEIDVLRTLYRFSRSRRTQEPTLELLAARLLSDEPSVRRALFALAQNGLIQRIDTPKNPRQGFGLSLAGLAVAVSCAKRPRPIVKQDPGAAANTTAASGERRHRAA